ncbi:hypothetical protein TNCV_3219771 [Trichonephila clavipes]|nr:hypothetical protein TNCV_3219771 [Trichonephila clavipes]
MEDCSDYSNSETWERPNAGRFPQADITLPILSKLAEKIILPDLTTTLERNNISHWSSMGSVCVLSTLISY